MGGIDRRHLLLSPTVFVAPVAVRANESEVAKEPSSVDVEIPKIELMISKVEDTQSPPNSTSNAEWVELKDRLVKAGNLPVAFDVSYEEGAVPLLTNALSQETAKKTHNPRLVEPLLGEIASLLDRCIHYRNEGASLEIQGMSAGAARLIFESTREIDTFVATADKTKEVSAIFASNYPKAAEQLRRVDDFGNATMLQAQAAANAVLRDALTGIQALSLGKLEFIQDISRQLMSRHDVAGNAHNFGERFENLRLLYNSDIEAAYRRALAAREGLEALFSFSHLARSYNFKAEVPKPKGSGFLDEFVVWTRNAMRAVAHVAQTEVEMERVLVMPIIKDVDLLDVRKEIFAGLRNIRLRGVAASFRQGATENVADLAETSFALVMVKTTNNVGPLTVIHLPQVGKYSVAAEPVTNRSSSLFNLDPVGEWSVRLSKRGTGSSYFESTDRGSAISHVLIKFQVVASLDPKIADGSWWMSADRL